MDPGEVDDYGDVPVTTAGVAPDVLVYPDHVDVVEAGRVADQEPLALGEDCVVDGVPRDPKAFGHASYGEVLLDQAFQRPSQTAS